MIDADAIVIGAGFAGLSAATALAEAGMRVTVVEARPHLGGRATTYRDPRTGERIDNGQHVLAGCYTETLQFLGRIGRESALRRPSSLHIRMIDEDGARLELQLPPLPSPLHLIGGILAWRELTWRERVAVLRVGPALMRFARAGPRAGPSMRRAHWGGQAPASAVTDETVLQWLVRHHQPARLCRLFWEPLALATLNQSIDRAAAGPFLTVIARMLAAGPDAATLLLPAAMLDEFYAEPSRTYINNRGGACRTGSPARIAIAGDRVKAVLVGTEILEARIVIAAVPWFAFAGLFESPTPPALQHVISVAERLESSPIVTVNIWFDRAVLEEDFLGLPGRAFQWVFDKRRIVGGALSHLSMVSSGAEDIVALDNDAIAARAVAELKAAVPAARAAHIRRVSIVRERRATFSLSPSMPRRPSVRTPVDGLLLAGDWIETGLPATIEGAVASGHVAARAALHMTRH